MPFINGNGLTMFDRYNIRRHFSSGAASAFFDFPAAKLDGTEVAKLGDLVG